MNRRYKVATLLAAVATAATGLVTFGDQISDMALSG